LLGTEVGHHESWIGYLVNRGGTRGFSQFSQRVERILVRCVGIAAKQGFQLAKASGLRVATLLRHFVP